jgi:ABC-type multidrug transport system permease subunit
MVLASKHSFFLLVFGFPNISSFPWFWLSKHSFSPVVLAFWSSSKKS